MYFEFDDLRQSYVIAVNEVRKFIRGKKLLVYVIIVALLFLLWTILPALAREHFTDVYTSPVELIYIYLYIMMLLIPLAAALFASNTIVSEFEERTALVLFTRPVKKTSIFLGKLAGCLVLETLLIVIYYLCLALVSLIYFKTVPTELFILLGIACLAITASTGIALLMSSLLKRSSTTIALTFFMLIMIIPIVSFMLTIGGVHDTWFMFVLFNMGASDPSVYLTIPTSFISGDILPMVHLARQCGMLIAWTIVPTVMAWYVFTKREF